MGQLIKACDAYGEHEAALIQSSLDEVGINCVLLRHEIPMKPGYTFGCLPWAEIYIDSDDAAMTSTALAAVPLKNSQGDNTDHPWPPYISLKSTRTLMLVYVLLTLVIPGMLQVSDTIQAYEMNSFVIWLFLGTPFLLTIWLLVLNWSRLSGMVRGALIGLAALLPGSVILMVELVKLLIRMAKALWRVFTYLLSNRP